MKTLLVNLPHNKGVLEVEAHDERQYVIVKEFLRIINEYSLNIEKKDIINILHMSGL